MTSAKTAPITFMSGKHNSNYRWHQHQSECVPLKPQTVPGSAKVTSQTLEVKGDPLPAHAFLPPVSFVLSPTSNVHICGPWAT